LRIYATIEVSTGEKLVGPSKRSARPLTSLPNKIGRKVQNILGGGNFSKRRRKMNGQDYIVNLAEQVVGRNVIQELEKQHVSFGSSGTDCDVTPDELFTALYAQVKAKVKEMNPKTIGYICTYALAEDADLGLGRNMGNFSGFVRNTTISAVHPQDFSSKLSGRELIEEIAVATIVGVIYDTINQSGWDVDRSDWQIDRYAYRT